jgi:hypothetical protein
METSGSITNFNNIEKAERNEKLRHFYAEAKAKNNEKRGKSMLDEHVQVYHKNTLKNIRFRGLSSRIHHLQHRHESQKSSGLIDGETLVLVIQNVWLD